VGSSELDRRDNALRWVLVVLAVLAIVTLVPLAGPLVLAMWFARLARPVHARITRMLGGRGRAASILIVVLFVSLFVPFLFVVRSLSNGAVDLVHSIAQSQGAGDVFKALASGDGGGAKGAGGDNPIATIAKEHGKEALGVLAVVAEVTFVLVIQVFVFFVSSYALLCDGPRFAAWCALHAPIGREPFDRLCDAFNEAGRGLLLSVGLTGLAQGILSSIAYFALGVPRPLVLGFLTCVASVLPLGTAFVWGPVAAGLALTGHPTQAIVLLAVGGTVILAIDNLVSPALARLGELRMPTSLVIVSLFGGLAAFGWWGILLGPLIVRLAREAFVLARERELVGNQAVEREEEA
jgi:predicted PurR-regulated permease PerM